MSLADKLTTVAENIPRVYQAGYDKFWDDYQDKGARTDYNHAFRGIGWQYSFKPKYNMQPLKAVAMFSGWGNSSNNVDLQAVLDEAGVTLDLSKAPSLNEIFNSSTVITRIGVINASSATTCNYMCNSASILKTIDKFIVTDKTTSLTGAFDYCPALENIVIEGTIGANISFSSCTKLTKSSITSIINALSSTSTGKTLTLSNTAITSAFGGTDSSEWQELTGTKTNWTISLI